MKERVELIDKEMLCLRTKQIGDEITRDYQGREVTLICILKGSMYFFADLTRNINLDTKLEFVRVSSYSGENSTSDIQFKLGLDEEVTGKNVIVVEDIIDTGKTLSYLYDYLKKQRPNSLKLCTLLDKPERREIHDVKVDYVGFTIPNYFAVGYGLDYDEAYRNLSSIECLVDTSEDKEKVMQSAVELKCQLVKK